MRRETGESVLKSSGDKCSWMVDAEKVLLWPARPLSKINISIWFEALGINGANGALSAWSGERINMLGRVRGLVKCFSSWKSLKYWIQVGGDWKRVSCHGNNFFYSRRCISFRTISLPGFNDLCCKLTEIALFIYLMLYWVENMTSSVLSFTYFTHFSNVNISGTNAYIQKR